MDNLGRKIRKLRIANNMSQIELGRELGVTDKCISRYENGDSEPKIDIILKLCELFDCDANYLLGIKNVYRHKNVVVTKQDMAILDKYHALDNGLEKVVNTIFEVSQTQIKKDRIKAVMYVAENSD